MPEPIKHHINASYLKNLNLSIIAGLLAMVMARPAPARADAGPDVDRTARDDAFGREIEGLRRLLGVPGLQVAVVKDGGVAFERAYGHADLKAKVPMTTDHLIEIASVTKTMTAVVMMQLVQEGKVSLDDRVVKYPFHRWFSPSRITPEVRLRHVLSHTSQGPPGETFAYQGNRFGFVLGVFGSPELYGEAVSRRILGPLHMEHTFPRPGVRMTDELKALLATHYDGFDAAGEATPVSTPPMPGEFYPSACFFSNAKDLARYAIALEDHTLISDRSHDLIEAPVVTRDGRVLPYGIGWFTQEFAGTRLVWHYGYGNGSSALLLRVPARRTALVVLANSGELSGSTRLGYGDVLDSPVAVSFLKHFVFAPETTHPSPPYDGDLASIRASLSDLRGKNAHPVYFEELFARAVVSELTSGPSRDSAKALGLLLALQEHRPNALPDSGLTGLEVLSRFDDARLNATTEALCRSLTRLRTVHPDALFHAAQFFAKTTRPDEAFRLFQRLADSEFEDDNLTLDACIKMGDHFAASDGNRARGYYWRAVRIGYPRPKVDRAIESLNSLDRR
jgi:CubicO group peptidase (beta-lactamase class C family)